MAVKTFNEGSYVTVTAKFYDGDTATTPSTARYRVDCETTRKPLLEWTEATPGTSITISVPATLNYMQDQAHTRERKVVTVEANYGTSTAYTNRIKYEIVNLQGVGSV